MKQNQSRVSTLTAAQGRLPVNDELHIEFLYCVWNRSVDSLAIDTFFVMGKSFLLDKRSAVDVHTAMRNFTALQCCGGA